MRVCDFIIFEIPILTVEIIYVADHTVKIGILNIIKSQTLTILGSFSGSLSPFEIHNYLIFTSSIWQCVYSSSNIQID